MGSLLKEVREVHINFLAHSHLSAICWVSAVQFQKSDSYCQAGELLKAVI